MNFWDWLVNKLNVFLQHRIGIELILGLEMFFFGFIGGISLIGTDQAAIAVALLLITVCGVLLFLHGWFLAVIGGKQNGQH